MLGGLLVGRPGITELLVILGVLLVPVAIVAFIVWIARRVRRDRGAEGG